MYSVWCIFCILYTVNSIHYIVYAIGNNTIIKRLWLYNVHCTLYSMYLNKQRCRKHLESGGCISTFFLIFWQFRKVGGVTKSQPIDPIFDVTYLFLNVRFGQKLFKFTHFWVPLSTLWMYYLALFTLNSSFFYSVFQNFFDNLFFAHCPYFSTPHNFFTPI